MEGAVDRVRPKIMTVASTMIGLLPILWGAGTGASVMKRIAAPHDRRDGIEHGPDVAGDSRDLDDRQGT